MAKILITMADNGKHLSHHGVKGQKWGVWNPETKARYEGVPVSGGGSSDEEEEITEKHFERDQEKELDAELKKLGIDPDNLDDKHNSWNDPFLNKLEAYWDRIDELVVSDRQKEQSSKMAASKQAEKRQAQREENRYNELKDINPLERTVEENEEFYELDEKRKKANARADMVTHADLQNKTCYLITMDTGEQFIAHHGVQGMKWGKWNAETAARYAGGTSKEAKKYNKGYAKYTKAKNEAEIAADRYVANPNVMNLYKANVAANRETSLNSDAARRATRRNIAAIAIGGTPGLVVNQMLPKQRNLNKDWQAQMLDTRATRLDEAIDRARDTGGYEASQKVKDRSAKLRRSADISIKDMENRQAEQERKKAAKQKVDSKISEAKEKSALQQHQEARKEFQNSNKTNQSVEQAIKNGRNTKEYREGTKQGYNLVNNFDVDRSSSKSRAQITQARDSMAELATKQLREGKTSDALNSMAKAEAFDHWLNSKDDDDFKKRLGI